VTGDPEPDLFTADASRADLAQLLTESRLYRSGPDYFALLDFVSRFPKFAPFNAMLLQLQRPGLRFAAPARDWWIYHRRRLKAGARPLIILYPFGPVALVYDVDDTEGDPLPAHFAVFRAEGSVRPDFLLSITDRLKRRFHVALEAVDFGETLAGEILRWRVPHPSGARYRLVVNKRYGPVVHFTTVAHELAHLFLGHLGEDPDLSIEPRTRPSKALRELEAESVAYLVCRRHGITATSHEYLAGYLKPETTVEDLDLYNVMWAAGKVEEAMLSGGRLFTK
jgi:hypothetical protein